MAKRIIERRRDELSQEIREARREYEAGRCEPVTPDELNKLGYTGHKRLTNAH